MEDVSKTETRAKTAGERAWITGISWCLPACDQIIVAEGHAIVPEAVEQMRADSFVMPCFDLSRGSIHYPTESSLIRDGLRKIIQMCLEHMPDHQLRAGTGMRTCGHR